MSISTLQMPERIEMEESSYSSTFGRFVVMPLEKGYGVTIGNTFRRVLLSSLQGSAITGIRIGEVLHEFTTIPGVREDVSMIILQLKQLIMKIEDDETYSLQISAKGPCTVTAGDITCPAQVEILNKDLEIAHLDAMLEELSLIPARARGTGAEAAHDIQTIIHGSDLLVIVDGQEFLIENCDSKSQITLIEEQGTTGIYCNGLRVGILV